MTTQPAIYVRQSVNHQEGIDRSLDRCRALVNARGWPAAQEFTDNAVSASGLRDENTDWGRMLARVKAGEFNTIVGVDLDRLARSTRDLNTLIDLGVKVLTVDGEIDLTTADGEFRATMLAGIARFETRRKGERQKRGNEWRVAQGFPVAGKRRYGFLPGNMQEDPHEAPRVRGLFEGIAAGDSVASWAKLLDRPAVRIREILTNPAYAGYVVRKGERFEAHESVARVVDRGLFETVQVLLADPSRKTSPGNTVRFLASGIARCGVCGGPMVKQSDNYICGDFRGQKGHPTIKVHMLDEWLRLAVQNGLMLWADNPGDEDAQEAARARVAELDEQIREGAADLMALSGTARTAVRVELARLEQERDAAVAEVSRALGAALPLTDLLETGNDDLPRAFDLTGNFDESFSALGIDRQRELVRRLVASCVVHRGKGQQRIELVQRFPARVPA